jgi:two-component system NtrC family sensor kinase
MPIAEPMIRPANAERVGEGQPESARPSASESTLARRLERAVSLRTELLVNLATLATAALLLAITTIVLFDAVLATPSGLALLICLVTADIVVFLLFGYHLTGRLVLQPLDAVVAAADRIAGGERATRVAERGAPEFVRLARAINALTDQLIAEQQRVVRVEKMASLGRLAAGVAHEVGNPLGAINGYAHLLRRHVAADAEAVGMVRDLEREAARVDRIMRGLLDYARPRRISSSLIAVGACVARVVEMLSEQQALAHVHLDVTMGESLPAVRLDAHALDQVLVNLLLNAAQATPADGSVHISAHLTSVEQALGLGARRALDRRDVSMPRNASLRLGAWRDGAHPEALIELVVADSGPGIPEEDLERVFDPFFTTKAPGQGTGLGLAIVARTIEDAGGIVFARASREGGAAFVILLPAELSPRPGFRSIEAAA